MSPPASKPVKWIALIVGIYGGGGGGWTQRYMANKAIEEEVHAYKAKIKPVWDAENAAKAANCENEYELFGQHL